jgi:hypothetical protein
MKKIGSPALKACGLAAAMKRARSASPKASKMNDERSAASVCCCLSI